MRRLLALAALSLTLASGCTSSDDGGPLGPDPSGSASTSAPNGDDSSSDDAAPGPTGPACDDVWQVGDDLPSDYSECAAGTEQGSQEVTECQDGSSLVVFDDVLYAVTGGQIKESDVSPLQDTPEFSAVFSDCTGE